MAHFYDDPSEPGKNADRAGWAESALETFAAVTGQDLDPEADGPEQVATDLLADLAHFCDRNGLSLRSLLADASTHYNEETGTQGEQFAFLAELDEEEDEDEDDEEQKDGKDEDDEVLEICDCGRFIHECTTYDDPDGQHYNR